MHIVLPSQYSQKVTKEYIRGNSDSRNHGKPTTLRQDWPANKATAIQNFDKVI